MAVLNTASLRFLNFREIPEVFHTRLIVEHIERMDYSVATPDLDLFLGLSNSDLVDCIPASNSSDFKCTLQDTASVALIRHAPHARLMLQVTTVSPAPLASFTFESTSGGKSH